MVNKKILQKSLILIIVFCMSVSSCVTAFSQNDADFNIKIVHTGDIHARISENVKKEEIGFEKLGSFIDEQTENSDIMLVLDSGDLFHGQPIATLVHGESVARTIESCGYDAMTSGNHDWSYGKDRLKELCNIAGVEMLSGNVIDKETSMPFFDNEFYIKTAQIGKNKLKVGVFGVIDPKIMRLTPPHNIKGLEFTDCVQYANKAAKELKKQGCDIVVALTHSYEPYSIAQQVSGVNLWLTGQENLETFKELADKDGNKTYVVESDEHFNSVNLINITGSIDKTGTIKDITVTYDRKKHADFTGVEKKTGVTDTINNIEKEYQFILDTKVCESPVNLNGENKDLRSFQQNLGNIVADAYIAETGADVAFENAGGIRSSVMQGNVTYGDIIGVSPYGDYIVTKYITGEELKEIVEISTDIQIRCQKAYNSEDIRTVPHESGDSLQFAGMTVTYDPDMEKGERVLSIIVGDEPLDIKRTYCVATNNYVAELEQYPQLSDALDAGQFASCDEVLIRFFSQGGETILKSACENRLFSINENESLIDSSLFPRAKIYVPNEQNVVVLEARYDTEGRLINILSNKIHLNAGMNFITMPYDGISDTAKVKLLFWNTDPDTQSFYQSQMFILK